MHPSLAAVPAVGRRRSAGTCQWSTPVAVTGFLHTVVCPVRGLGLRLASGEDMPVVGTSSAFRGAPAGQPKSSVNRTRPDVTARWLLNYGGDHC